MSAPLRSGAQMATPVPMHHWPRFAETPDGDDVSQGKATHSGAAG